MTTLVQSQKNTTAINTGSRKVTLLHFGARGLPGSSAYAVAVANGFVGTEVEWLASLQGADGPQGLQGNPGAAGADGADGAAGANGADGDSAYAVAVANGFVGTEVEWLASLIGPQGPEGPPGAGGGSGTVTSVAISVPTGLSVAGSPITTNGTFTITFAAGYSIPTDAAQADWNTAFGWGNHASAGYLTAETDPVFSASASAGITTPDITNWNTAYGWGNHASAGYIASSEKGAALGVATLGADSKIPVGQLPAAVLGALSYQGTWNATTNTPTIPAASSGNKGHFYKVATAGSTDVDGITDWKIGDWIVSNGTAWDKVDNTDLVSSVNGQAGAVVLGYGDVGAEPAISAGTTAQYWRGDKGWRDFATDVRGAVLTGLSLAATTVVAATHTVLEAIGFLQAQITAYKDATITFTAKTFNLSNNTLTGTLAEFNAACSDADFADKATLIGKVYLGTWPASAMKPATTNGCDALAWDESTTNKVMDGYCGFSASADQYAHFSFIAPKGMDEGTFAAQFEWKEAASATAHNVVWQIEMQAQGDADTIDSAWGTAVTVQDTGTNSTTRRLSAETGAITPGGTWATGDVIKVRVSRKASDTTNDTLDVKALLLAVKLLGTNTTLVEP